MRVWVTVVGRSRFAVINTVWSACIWDSFVPQCVHLVKNTLVEDNVKAVREWVKKILSVYGVPSPSFEEHDSDEDDMNSFADILRNVVQNVVSEGNEVAVDITPGRKFMSAFAMILGQKFRVPKLYYLHLYDPSYVDKPFVLIPFNLQKLVNLAELLDKRKGSAEKLE